MEELECSGYSAIIGQVHKQKNAFSNKDFFRALHLFQLLQKVAPYSRQEISLTSTLTIRDSSRAKEQFLQGYGIINLQNHEYNDKK